MCSVGLHDGKAVTMLVSEGDRGANRAVDLVGIAGVAREPAPVNPSSTYSDSFTRSEYPAYPVLTPSGSSNYSQSYPSGPNRGQEPGNIAHSYGGNSGSQHPSSVPQYQSTPDYRGYGQQHAYSPEKAYPAPPQPPQVASIWARSSQYNSEVMPLGWKKTRPQMHQPSLSKSS